MTGNQNTGSLLSRKPRVALMGEFSSGKSTLSNLLLGEAPLPMKVTATRLPPVWITWGEPASYAVSKNGSEVTVDLRNLNDICLENIEFIKLYRRADILQVCDIIDTPGISDPNMKAVEWEPSLALIDCVVWCTHATQAWRQSEVAMWDQVAGSTNGNNILLVTQFDKLKSEFERARVLNRMRSEAGGMFKEIFAVSLLQAIEAGDDFAIWKQSGAGEFIEYLVSLLLQTPLNKSRGIGAMQQTTLQPSPSVIVEHVAEVVDSDLPSRTQDVSDADRIRPKRVRIKTRITPRTPRPPKHAVGGI
ncbi:dynamin family protein [Marivita geojedonensis]|uniref:Dynamin N-terminal domain-containing protein n=1 Tax=Marivita geojedonensis TaxID=1123756 RepID=A0A1X4N989_9RHOB|nr:dynamin family protein [Marivita geojedonensis]OSQ42930.1 hypothetical protein MGEO_20115 [Marivita geojedonensis]PRY72130.1 dynamin family protein [Marivita geojedonensis]